jgi:hypothetical protein
VRLKKYNLPKKKIIDREIQCKIPSTSKEELLPILKLFQNIERERIFPNLLHGATNTLLLKTDKDRTKRNHISIALINTDDMFLNKTLAN